MPTSGIFNYSFFGGKLMCLNYIIPNLFNLESAFLVCLCLWQKRENDNIEREREEI
jgi:hypothetical protein